MRADTARKVVELALDCTRIVDESVATLRNDGCSQQEWSRYGRHAGEIMADIFRLILAPLYDEHPPLAPDWYRDMDLRKKNNPKEES
jgi:hypothetical protein